jgi:hypothetical protein
MADKPEDAAKSFDAYEVIGVITPGALLLLFIAYEWPELQAQIGSQDFNLGQFGLFVLAAFVLGHLLQGVSELIEKLLWFGRGMPTDWIWKEGQTLVSGPEAALFRKKVDEMKTGKAEGGGAFWPVIRRVYARVEAAKRTARIDAFNRTYGLFRGLASALLLCLGYALLVGKPNSELVVLSAALVSALWGMRRFGINYARELIVVFLDLPARAASTTK